MTKAEVKHLIDECWKIYPDPKDLYNRLMYFQSEASPKYQCYVGTVTFVTINKLAKRLKTDKP